MSSHLKLNPWLIVVGVAVVLIFGSMAQFGSLLSTKAKPVPNKIQPGDSYPVTYKTSADVPSVRIDLCSDSTNTACIPMTANATGSQTNIVIPGTFATGQAHINVLERNKAGQLTGKIQSTIFLTIFAPGTNPDSAGTGSSSNTGSSGTSGSSTSSTSGSSFLSNLFGGSSSGTSTSTTTSTSTPTATPLPECQPTDCLGKLTPDTSCSNGTFLTTACQRQLNGQCQISLVGTCPTVTSKICQPTDCGSIPTMYRYCTNGFNNQTVPTECASTGSSCALSLPNCPSGYWETTAPTPTPTPTPDPVYYKLTIFTSFTNGQPHLAADVLWYQPTNDAVLKMRADNGNNYSWFDPIFSYTGNARFDLTANGIKDKQYIWIEAVDPNTNKVFGTPQKYYIPAYDGNSNIYIDGKTGQATTNQ